MRTAASRAGIPAPAIRFRRVVIAALVATVAITWPLWNLRTAPPLVPFLPLPVAPAGAALVGALLLALLRPRTGAALALAARGEHAGVGDDEARLVDQADEVLAFGRVDRGLAADAGIDLGKQRRRNLHEIDAALDHRGGEARPGRR